MDTLIGSTSRIRSLLLLIPILALAACSGESKPSGGSDGHAGHGGSGGEGGTGGEAGAGGDGGSGGEAGAGGSGGGDPQEDCRAPGPADYDRVVVVGHRALPGVEGSEDHYEILVLRADGSLEATGENFKMGRPGDEPVVFTPDGKLGFVTQMDGTVGVFRVNEGGAIEVVDPKLGEGTFYAANVKLSPKGDRLFVNDENWPGNGGGIYVVEIGCDDSLTVVPERILATKSGKQMVLLGDDDAVLAARSIGEDEDLVDHDVYRLSLADPASKVAELDLFTYEEWGMTMVSDVKAMPNGRHLLVANNEEFSGEATRVAAVEIGPDVFESRGTIEIEDPYSIATSPFGDAALVVSGYGDTVFVLDYEADSEVPFTNRGQVEYEEGRPQLPGKLAVVERGSLMGRVLIPEVRGLFQIAFGAGATVTDLGLFATGSTPANVGVQP